MKLKIVLSLEIILLIICIVIVSILNKPTEIANEIPKQLSGKKSNITVRIFSDFSTSESAKNNFLSICTSEFPRINFTSNDDYTHCVILNTCHPNINTIPKKNVLGLALEPLFYLNITPEFVDYTKQYVGQYYIGENTYLGPPFVAFRSFLWHTPIPTSILRKHRLMSIVFSDKKETMGHKYRHELVNEIIRENLPIDIWGKGCEKLKNSNSRVMGSFGGDEPYDSYQFTIVIENAVHSHYVSEKFINPLMFATIPIYYGASCVDDEFEHKFIRLTGKIQNDIELIKDILIHHEQYIKIINRQKIAEQCDLIRHLNEIW
jgi:hypothetical protein